MSDEKHSWVNPRTGTKFVGTKEQVDHNKAVNEARNRSYFVGKDNVVKRRVTSGSSKPIDVSRDKQIYSDSSSPGVQKHTPKPGQEQFDIEKARPSISHKEAKEQGHIYSGAIGYYRIPGTDKNLRISKSRLEQQKKQIAEYEQSLAEQRKAIRAAPEGARFIHGNRAITKKEALGNVARSEKELAAAKKNVGADLKTVTHVTSAKAQQKKVAQQLAGHSLDGFFHGAKTKTEPTKNATRRPTASPSSPITQSPIDSLITYSPTTIKNVKTAQDGRSIDINDSRIYKKIYEKASPLQKTGLHASTLFSTEGMAYIGAVLGLETKSKNIKTTEDAITRRMKMAYDERHDLKAKQKHIIGNPVTQAAMMGAVGKAIGAVGGSLKALPWVTKASKTAIGHTAIKGTAVGVGGSLAILEGQNIKQKVDKGDVGEAAGQIVRDLVGTGLLTSGVKSTGKHINKPKIIDAKFTGREHYAVQGKHAESSLFGKMDMVTKRMFGKPKKTTQRLNLYTIMNFNKKGFFVRGSSNIRVTTPGSKPHLKASKTDFEGNINTVMKKVMGGKHTPKITEKHLKTRLDIADYTKPTMKLKGHAKATDLNIYQNIKAPGKLQLGDYTIKAGAERGKFLNAKHTGKMPATKGTYAGGYRTISGGNLKSPVTHGATDINAKVGNLLKRTLHLQELRIATLGKVHIRTQHKPSNKPLDFSWLKSDNVDKVVNAAIKHTSSKSAKTPGSLRLSIKQAPVKSYNPEQMLASSQSVTDTVLKNALQNIQRQSLTGHPAVNTGNMGRIGGISLSQGYIETVMEPTQKKAGRIAPAIPRNIFDIPQRMAQIRVPETPTHKLFVPPLPKQAQMPRQRQRPSPINLPQVPTAPRMPNIRAPPVTIPLIEAPIKKPRIGPPGRGLFNPVRIGGVDSSINTSLKVIDNILADVDKVL